MPTTTECRDKLAEMEGWKKKHGRWYHPVWHKLGSGQKRHPIPATLDAAAAAMPEGWGWELSYNNWWTDLSDKHEHVNRLAYQAIAHGLSKEYDGPDGQCVMTDPCDTAEQAMFNLALLAREKGKNDGH
jgi:hypothetical protein